MEYMMQISKKLILSSLSTFVIFSFLGCGGDDSSSGLTSSTDTTQESNESDNNLNPNYDLYDEQCHQSSNSSLCGFEGGGSSGLPPVIPESINECEDQENCL
jgi:hypothetical protein